jgi:hypothetical protein
MGDPPPPTPESHNPDGLDNESRFANRNSNDSNSLRPSVDDNAEGAGKIVDAPPFWTRHDRSLTAVSYHSMVTSRPTPILLEDHSEETHEQSLGCWARSVTVDDYVIVSGPSGIGAYLVWNCTVSTLKGGDMSIRKR